MVEVLDSLIRDVEVFNIRKKYENGMSVADIAREVGYSEKTIRKWLRSEATPRYPERAK